MRVYTLVCWNLRNTSNNKLQGGSICSWSNKGCFKVTTFIHCICRLHSRIKGSTWEYPRKVVCNAINARISSRVNPDLCFLGSRGFNIFHLKVSAISKHGKEKQQPCKGCENHLHHSAPCSRCQRHEVNKVLPQSKAPEHRQGSQKDFECIKARAKEVDLVEEKGCRIGKRKRGLQNPDSDAGSSPRGVNPGFYGAHQYFVLNKGMSDLNLFLSKFLLYSACSISNL